MNRISYMRPISRNVYLGAVYTFLYIPILVLIVFSFNQSDHSFLWSGFTWKWYQVLIENKNLQIVAFHSLVIAFLAASGSTLLGTLMAICLHRYEFFGRKMLYALIFMLIISPDLVIGISLLILFSAFKAPLGFWSLLLSHITFCLPFVIVVILARLAGQDKFLFEAAKDLGATEGVIFHKILIPLLWPGIISAWLLGFTLSMDDVMISFFVSGPEFDILPLKIFSMVRTGVKPEANALCSVMFVLTLVIIMLCQFISWKRSPQ